MQQGTISRLNHSRGFGFLTTPDGEDLFFHRTNVNETPFARLQVGDRVTYKGLKATVVRVTEYGIYVQKYNYKIRIDEKVVQRCDLSRTPEQDAGMDSESDI